MRGSTSAPLHKHCCLPMQASRKAASLEKKQSPSITPDASGDVLHFKFCYDADWKQVNARFLDTLLNCKMSVKG